MNHKLLNINLNPNIWFGNVYVFFCCNFMHWLDPGYSITFGCDEDENLFINYTYNYPKKPHTSYVECSLHRDKYKWRVFAHGPQFQYINKSFYKSLKVFYLYVRNGKWKVEL